MRHGQGKQDKPGAALAADRLSFLANADVAVATTAPAITDAPDAGACASRKVFDQVIEGPMPASSSSQRACAAARWLFWLAQGNMRTERAKQDWSFLSGGA
jgi:hypothetical protein